MSNAVISSLEENLRNIRLVAEPTVAGFTSDRGNTGDRRELTVQQFIASYLLPSLVFTCSSLFADDLSTQPAVVRCFSSTTHARKQLQQKLRLVKILDADQSVSTANLTLADCTNNTNRLI